MSRLAQTLGLTEFQTEIITAVRQFVDREIIPTAQELEHSDTYPQAIVGAMRTMGLFGLIIAMIVNIFLQSSAMTFVISALGVVIFTGLTAYDTQKIRAFGENAPLDDATAIRRGALLGALTLYLDFINLFLMLLRLMGDRR